MTHRVIVSGTAGRDHPERLPESVAAAAIEFIFGDLTDRPHRVGKPLLAPLDGRYSARRGQYRIQYAIDDQAGTMTILAVTHRRDAYHS